MKTIKVKQLSVEVGRCSVHSLPYLEYLLKVSINKDLNAATSFKPTRDGQVDFGTRLFLRLDNSSPQEISKCLLQVTGLDEKGNKREVGQGWASSKQEGLQVVQLQPLDGSARGVSVELEFALSVVEVKESKSINNKFNSYKSHISQKQSSCDQHQSFGCKTSNNFSSTPILDKYAFQHAPQTLGCTLKTSNSEKMLCNNSEELYTSAATARLELKGAEGKYKEEDSQTLLCLQIKIDQLQEKLSEVKSQLSECSSRLDQAETRIEQEKKKNALLLFEKEELRQLLSLQQLRSQLAVGHVARLNVLFNQLKRDEGPEIYYIEEKDEIVMINEELELDLAAKNGLISQLQSQLGQLKLKLAQLQPSTDTIPTLPHEPELPQKLPILHPKELDKLKSQRKIFDKNTPIWNKKQQDYAKETTKQTNVAKQLPSRPKDREPDKKKIKKQTQINKIPPPRQTKDIKMPVAPQTRVTKVKSAKNLKPQQRQTQKKSSNIQSSLPSLAIDSELPNEPYSLMLNSRALQSLSKHPSHIKNSIQ